MLRNPIYDISFAGCAVTIDGKEINEFMDDASPVEIQDTDTCNIEWSCNGSMIRTVKPAAIILSVTVIPGSQSDKNLKEIWRDHYLNGGDVDLDKCNAQIAGAIKLSGGDGNQGQSHSGAGWIREIMFYNGTCISGAAGYTANGQGKMGGNTYTFAFQTIQYS